MWATRPHLASIFEKLLDQKTFCLPAARGWQSWFLGKTVFHVRQKGFHPCFCLPACCNCPVALSEFVTCFIRAANSELGSFKNCNCSRENRLQNNLLRKCGLLAHTSPAFLKNCWIKKLFVCLRLVLQNTPYIIQIRK